MLEQVRRIRPDVTAAVNIAELSWDGKVLTRLRLPPGVAGLPAMLVVRLDDSFHRAPQEGTGTHLEQALGRLLAAVDLGLAATPVELDYDSPVARLPVYAAWLDTCRAGALRGRTVWITSLPTHLDEPGFGALFASRVDGHVPQVFDTGEPWTPRRAEVLADGWSGRESRSPWGLAGSTVRGPITPPGLLQSPDSPHCRPFEASGSFPPGSIGPLF